MSITHVTDHYEQAVARLPMVYKDKPRFLAWLAAYCARVQNIEDALWDVYVDRLIQNSPTGDLLAKLGAIVGQTDLLGDDVSFLLFIQARILVNRSKGRRRDLIRVTQAMWPIAEPPVVWQWDFPGPSVLIAPQAAVAVSPHVAAQEFIGPAVAAGVSLSYVWSPAVPLDTIVPASIHASGFGASPPVTTPDIASTQYTGSVHASGFLAGPPPSATSGGTLAGVIRGVSP